MALLGLYPWRNMNRRRIHPTTAGEGIGLCIDEVLRSLTTLMATQPATTRRHYPPSTTHHITTHHTPHTTSRHRSIGPSDPCTEGGDPAPPPPSWARTPAVRRPPTAPRYRDRPPPCPRRNPPTPPAPTTPADPSRPHDPDLAYHKANPHSLLGPAPMHAPL